METPRRGWSRLYGYIPSPPCPVHPMRTHPSLARSNSIAAMPRPSDENSSIAGKVKFVPNEHAVAKIHTNNNRSDRRKPSVSDGVAIMDAIHRRHTKPTGVFLVHR